MLGAPDVQGTPVKETPGALRTAKIGAGKSKKRKGEAKAVVPKSLAIFKKRATRSTSKADPRIRREIKAQTEGRVLWKVYSHFPCRARAIACDDRSPARG